MKHQVRTGAAEMAHAQEEVGDGFRTKIPGIKFSESILPMHF